MNEHALRTCLLYSQIISLTLTYIRCSDVEITSFVSDDEMTSVVSVGEITYFVSDGEITSFVSNAT
jgi:hypothetical protein